MTNGTAITASDKLTGQSDCPEVNLDVNISFVKIGELSSQQEMSQIVADRWLSWNTYLRWNCFLL